MGYFHPKPEYFHPKPGVIHSTDATNH